MIRRTPLKRSTKPIARRRSIPRKRATPRRGPFRDPGYLVFLRNECKSLITAEYGCDPAHGPVNGRGSKGPDNEAVPLSRTLHDEQTRIGWPAFEAKYGIDRAREAAAHYTLYLIWKETTGVVDK